jgi:hypothetical protein
MSQLPRRRGKRNLTPAEVRDSLRYYADPDQGEVKGLIVFLLNFLLRSFCLTLEVFLHGKIGSRYLTVPKALVGWLFPWICFLLAGFGFGFMPGLHVDSPGLLDFWRPLLDAIGDYVNGGGFERGWTHMKTTVAALLNPDTRVTVAGPVGIAVTIYSIIFNMRLVEAFVRNRVAEPAHPNSSGDPWFVWNPIYILFHRLNFRIDVVKQFGEPALCLFTGLEVYRHASAEWHFVGVWLILGALFMLVRMYLENRRRSKLFYDRVANEMNARAFTLQEQQTTAAGEKVFCQEDGRGGDGCPETPVS